MDFIQENKSFILCSFGTLACVYHLLKITLENWRVVSLSAQKSKAMEFEKLKNKNSPESNSNNNNKLPSLSITRMHLFQRKLDVYSNEMKIIKGNNISLENQPQSYVYKICLTGGPNAGKTTTKTHIREMLRDRGYKVYTVPLITSLTNESGGMTIYSGLDDNGSLKFQTYLIKLQMNLEDYFTSLAILGGEKTIIICDRGIMDLQQFGSDENWQYILTEHDWNVINLRDRRYDAVIHLVTSAEGAVDYYKSRHQGLSEQDIVKSIEKAKSIDEKIKNLWMGHPHYTIIDNSGPDFKSKINKAFSCVCKFVGLPTLNKYIRKFLLENYLIPPNVKVEEFQVTEIFLPSKMNQEVKIRKRGQNGAFTYMSSILEKKTDGYHLETKKVLTAREFAIMISQKDEKHAPLEKERKSFIWNQQLYIIDSIKLQNKKTIEILRFDTQAKDEQFVIPPFCKISKEVTDEVYYNSIELAKIDNA